MRAYFRLSGKARSLVWLPVLVTVVVWLVSSSFLPSITDAAAVTFTPVADAYVNAGSPSSNYGTSTQLRVDGSPIENSYLRFTVANLSGAVTSATLRVYATSSQSTGYTASAVSDNTWTESTLNYSNAPAIGAAIGSSGAVSANTWTSVNVTSYITGNGTFNLALSTTNSTALALSSRESGANAPQLVIQVATAPTPTNTNTATNTPTNTPVNTPTNTSAPTNTATNTATNTPINTPTNTNTPTITNTPTNTNTPTATNTPTNTSAPTNTPTVTNTATNTPTDTPTNTATPSPTATLTPTATSTPVPGTLCVLVYNDLNGNGLYDQGEPLLTGAQTTVKNSSAVLVGQWTTNGTEPFCFPNLPPDNYTVTEVNPPGYASVSPDLLTLPVTSGTSVEADYGDQAFTPTPTATNTATNTPTSTPTPTPTFTSTPTRTATPLPTAAGDPVIVAAGDIACDPANANFSGSSTSSCQMVATSRLVANISPSAVLILGDNQYYCGSLSAYQQAYALSWGLFKSITHPSVGNHEYLTSGGTGCDSTNTGAAGYFNYFGSSAGTMGQGYYSYDVGTWHLIALNSNCSNAGGCSSGSPQGKWLTADLAAHSNTCTLAYWHIPVWSSGGRASSNMSTLTQILYNANADLILDAHDHDYERFAPQNPQGQRDTTRGIRSFVVGTGGANHTSFTTVMANSEVRNDTTFGVLKLTLHASSFDWQFVPVAGQSFTDSGTQACH